LLLGGLAAAAMGTGTSGCQGGPTDPEGASALLLAALRDVGPEVVLPGLDRFLVEAAALREATEGWSAAAESDGDTDTARADAQARWLDTMAVWQELELTQIGPTGSSLSVIEGEDRRDEIYSWPTVNACRIDQETVDEGWLADDYFSANLVNSYGLDALEHLLFFGEGNDCPGQVEINADGSWDALGAEGVTRNRAAFAVVLATEVETQGAALRTRWDEDDFSATLAGDTEPWPYGDGQTALNAVFDALFYLELLTKDRKLAQPLGLVECSDATCPDDVEGLTSGSGGPSVAANLRGFRALFTGGEGTGMDDLLEDVGHGDLSEQILADTDAAILAAESIDPALDVLIEDDPDAVQAVHDAVKKVTDALKGDLATVLALEIPSEASGDAD